MIRLRFKEIRARIGKSLTEIAKETGLNRNTVNTIFSEKVDGFKLDTLDKICKTYNLSLTELLEFQPETAPAKVGYYRQEGEVVPFTSWPWFILINKLDPKYFRQGFGQLKCFFKEGYAVAYWQVDQLYNLSRSVYQDYGSDKKIDDIYQVYRDKAEKLSDLYENFDNVDYQNWDKEKLLRHFNLVADSFYDFWSISLFIDSFDAGFDHDEIKRIADKVGLNTEDVSILTTPAEMTFNNERLFSLLRIIKKLKKELTRKKGDSEQLKNYLSQSSLIQEYIKRFDYYKTSYLGAKPITLEEVQEEVLKYLQDSIFFEKEYQRLENYCKNQQEAISSVLRKRKLKTNPLYFFNRLTYWREDRKKVNLMGIYLLDMFLLRLEKITGISKKYLQSMTFDEVNGVCRGQLKKDELMDRYHGGEMIIVDNDDYRIITGKEASSLKDDLDRLLNADKKDEVIAGKVASQGYAKGFARVVLKQEDFGKFKEGEILVTVMTRPEYVPIMKKAAAIVTDEGGITCHAAIVSRELNKPCIIGTQSASKLIHDGDLIEVRANHGTVRILEKAS